MMKAIFYDNLDKGSDEMKRMNAIPKVRMGTIRYIHHPDAATKGFNMYVDMMKEKLVQKTSIEAEASYVEYEGSEHIDEENSCLLSEFNGPPRTFD